MEYQQLTDKCPMPHGKHKDTAMADVPASYLLWYEEDSPFKNQAVLEYIEDNREVLKMETSKKYRR